MANNDTIDKILEVCDIVDIISEAVNLKQRGSNFVGLCPFHNEKTPSFSVSNSKGIYKCFGCGKGGNVFTFMKEYYGMDFKEALKELAGRYSIPLPQYSTSKKQRENLTRRELAVECIELTSKYFSKLLDTTGGKKALQYLKKREFSEETIKEFQIGYSPEGWDGLYNYLSKKGYKENTLLDAGLVIKKEKGGYYDRFRDRLMFPIHDNIGRIVGFGARKLGTEENQPKYINSPDSILYDKSRVLYGLHQGKNDIRQKESVILTEGYADVMALHQAGFRNTVASSGTSLTKEQINILKRYCSYIYIIYDADEAGINAALRAVDIALSGGLEVRIVSLPQGEDPDSFIRKKGAQVFQEFLNDAEIFVDFKINLLYKQNKLSTPAEKAAAVRDTINSIVRIPDRLQHDDYIARLAGLLKLTSRQIERIYNEKTKIESKFKAEEIRDTKEEEKRQAAERVELGNISGTKKSEFKPDYSSLLHHEKLVLQYMLSNNDSRDYIFNVLAIIPENFYSGEGKRILMLLIDLYSKNPDIVKHIGTNDEVHPEDVDFILRLAMNDIELSKEWKSYAKGMKEFDNFKPIRDALKQIEIYKLEKRIDELQELQRSEDEEIRQSALEEFMQISKQRQTLTNLSRSED